MEEPGAPLGTISLVKLPPREVHIWTIPLWPVPGDLSRHWSVLDDEERRRADRFMFDRDRHQLVISHHATRAVLADMLRLEPQELRFQKAEHGKPSLVQDPALRFNLSHSHHLALLAVCRQAEVGVDVEYTGRPVEYRELGDRFFARPEAEGLRAVPESGLGDVFFTIWTRKEAYIKALGEGLTHPLDRFCVWSPQDESPRLTSQDAQAQRWSLCDLEVPEDYRGALVIEGQNWTVRQHTFKPC